MKATSTKAMVPTRKRATPRLKPANEIEIPPDDGDDGDSSAERDRAELSKRAISAWEATKCCIRSRNDASRFVGEVTDQIEKFYHEPDPPGEPMQAGIRIPSAVYQHVALFFIKNLPKKSPGVFFTTLGWDPIKKDWETFDGNAYPLPKSDGEMERMRAVAQEVQYRIRDKSDKECKACMRQRMWGQDKRRKGVTILASRTKNPMKLVVVGDRRLNLRVPHR